MSHTVIALKKILNELVPKEYPGISGINVVDDEWGGIHKYKIFLGAKPADYNKFDKDNVRDYVNRISKYVLGKYENIGQILFYNSENISKS